MPQHSGMRASCERPDLANADMPDMRNTLERLTELLRRKERFTYDLRGECQVYEGIVSAYRATAASEHFTELLKVVAHAAALDGVIGAWKDPAARTVQFDSCRLFTDLANAKRFAKAQGQRSIYDLYRNEEVWLTEETKVDH
jgi:fructokinase